MKVLSPNILLFENAVDKKLLTELDSYYTGVPDERYPWICNLSDDVRNNISKFIDKKIKKDFYDHYLYLGGAQLEGYSIVNYIRKGVFNGADYKGPDPDKNKLENFDYFSTRWTGAMMLTRMSSVYSGNRVKWSKSDKADKFTYLIGLSKESEHDSEITFPLHGISVKLNRGDLLIFPAGIISPYAMKLFNGEFKFIESV